MIRCTRPWGSLLFPSRSSFSSEKGVRQERNGRSSNSEIDGERPGSNSGSTREVREQSLRSVWHMRRRRIKVVAEEAREEAQDRAAAKVPRSRTLTFFFVTAGFDSQEWRARPELTVYPR